MTSDVIFLCKSDQVAPLGSKGFVIDEPSFSMEMFVVHDGENYFAYENRCPHQGLSLNWVPDQFLSLDGTEIQCASHDARFRIEDGVCISGPCPGQKLSPLEVIVRDGWLLVNVKKLRISNCI